MDEFGPGPGPDAAGVHEIEAWTARAEAPSGQRIEAGLRHETEGEGSTETGNSGYNRAMALHVSHLNPPTLPRNPALSQAVRVEGTAHTIYVGGQNAVGPDGVIGEDIGAQTTAALDNLQTVLAEAGADLENVVTWSILVVEGQPLGEAFASFQEVWGGRGKPPAISVALVAGLANPGFLVEISAIAVVSAGP